MATSDSTKRKLKQIFETMDYANSAEDDSKMTKWLESKNRRLFSSKSPEGPFTSVLDANRRMVCEIYFEDVETILNKPNNEWFQIIPRKRAEIMFKLGTEIQKQQDLFIQVEEQIRGILGKDTKKVLPLLTDCLQFYSSFCIKNKSENSSWKPQGVVAGIISNENAISALGYILGPSLAAGYSVILQTDLQLSIAAAALIDIAVQVGVPENTISLIPRDKNTGVIFNHPRVSLITIFDDLSKEKYKTISVRAAIKVMHFFSPGIPMLVFEDCDLNSACGSVINAAWGHKGMLPWSVRKIFIQESVYDNFVQKLRLAVRQTKVGKGGEKNVDVALPDPYVLEKLEKVVEKAASEGAEIYRPNDKCVFPAVAFGHAFQNNVIKENDNEPLVTLVAFRTINEAAALANETRYGLGASIWTENLSLANEIIGKLKVANIWFNSHGSFAADVSFSPYKSSGEGFFGGPEGFYENISPSEYKFTDSSITDSNLLKNAIGEAKKGQNNWAKLCRLDRIKQMQEFAQNIQRNSCNLSENWINEWIDLIHDYIINGSKEAFNKNQNFNVSLVREPMGIVAVDARFNVENIRKLIIAALVEGNALVVFNLAIITGSEFYSFVAKTLPKGIFSVISWNPGAIEDALNHPEINVYFAQYISPFSLNVKQTCKYKITDRKIDWTEARNQVTHLKTVWYNKAQSFM